MLSVLRQVEAEALVERIFAVLEESANERFVHDRHMLGRLVVGLGEMTAARELDPEKLEVVGADAIPRRASLLAGLRRRMPGHQDEFAPVVGERIVERESSAANTREPVEPFLQGSIECRELLGSVGGRRPVQGHEHAALNFIAEVLMLEFPEAAGQHHRARDQHDGKRGLHDEQRLARKRRVIAGAAAGAAQRVHRIRARRKPCRHGAKENAGQERQRERKRQHHWLRIGIDRHESGPGEGQRHQQPRRADRDGKPDDAAGDREENALDERLRNDLTTRGADRQSQRGLTATRHRTREQQVGDVGAGNEQHQPAHPEQNLQAPARTAPS